MASFLSGRKTKHGCLAIAKQMPKHYFISSPLVLPENFSVKSIYALKSYYSTRYEKNHFYHFGDFLSML